MAKKTKKVSYKNATTKTMVINIVLDESSSMSLTRNETILSLNDYIDNLRSNKSNKNRDIRISLIKFNSISQVQHSGVSIADFPAITTLTYNPSGCTALFDAVADSIRETEKIIRDTKINHKNVSVLTIILTDGEENSSREFSRTQPDRIKQLVQSKTDEGNWTFVYLGADIDAWSGAAALGGIPSNAFAYDENSISDTLKAVSRSTQNQISSYYTKGVTQNNSFFDNKDDYKNVQSTKIDSKI